MNAQRIIGGGGGGAGLGAVAVYVANRLGAHLTPEDGAVAEAAAIVLIAFVAHNGIRGAFRAVWHGATEQHPAPPAPPAP